MGRISVGGFGPSAKEISLPHQKLRPLLRVILCLNRTPSCGKEMLRENHRKDLVLILDKKELCLEEGRELSSPQISKGIVMRWEGGRTHKNEELLEGETSEGRKEN